jgi:hypothetical protein
MSRPASVYEGHAVTSDIFMMAFNGGRVAVIPFPMMLMSIFGAMFFIGEILAIF